MNKHIIDVTNWREALGNAKADATVGIRIAPLTQNASFSMYVTELPPNKKITAHYHQEGIEIYSILSGSGVLYTALVNCQNEPTCIQEKPVNAGDFFNIAPGVIHQLANPGQEPLILVFGCSDTHLTSDRIVTMDLTSR
jgi:mannose-6-phosphate isomerase-like protein (cupin superfamily)